MMGKTKKIGVLAGVFLVVAGIYFLLGFFEKREFLIDSFERKINTKTVDFGASEGSSLKVEASNEFKVCGEQSLKLIYELKPSGYMYCARGFGLDVKDAVWRVKPQKINWAKFDAFSIYMYGNKSGVVAFDIKDAGGEYYRYIIKNDFHGWKEIVCPFSGFFVREDWQPPTADGNGILDFPIMSFQWEPRLPGKGILYFDCVKVIKIK